jgi:large subunit ribosomal protein L4
MVKAKLYSFSEAAEPTDAALDDRVFGGEVNEDLLYRTVQMQLANRRQGTHSTKTRGEVRGGGRKPWRQKGTGRARVGTRRSPLWVGGGTMFGPKPRSYETKLTRKMRQGALIAALSARAKAESLILLDKADFVEPKTKTAVALLERLGIADRTALVVLSAAEYGKAAKKSFTNLPSTKCIACAGVNVYDVVRHDALVMTLAAVDELKERFSRWPS